ncbi:MAG: hypothetical protein U0R28_12440 [Candidatus Nanopelagicales bacterium]
MQVARSFRKVTGSLVDLFPDLVALPVDVPDSLANLALRKGGIGGQVEQVVLLDLQRFELILELLLE